MRFAKVRLRSNRTIHLQVLSVGRAGILGRRVDPKTLEDTSYSRADGAVVDNQDFVLWRAMRWFQPMRENRRYGELEADGPRLYSRVGGAPKDEPCEDTPPDEDLKNVEQEQAEGLWACAKCTCGHARVTHMGRVQNGGWGHDGGCSLGNCSCTKFEQQIGTKVLLHPPEEGGKVDS